MPEIVTTAELLEFLVKADKVSSHVNFTKREGEYVIGVHCDWDDNNNFYTQITCISEEGHINPFGEYSNIDFFEMNDQLDVLVKKEEVREQRRQKRQELLSRLTDEEKELLGV